MRRKRSRFGAAPETAVEILAQNRAEPERNSDEPLCDQKQNESSQVPASDSSFRITPKRSRATAMRKRLSRQSTVDSKSYRNESEDEAEKIRSKVFRHSSVSLTTYASSDSSVHNPNRQSADNRDASHFPVDNLPGASKSLAAVNGDSDQVDSLDAFMDTIAREASTSTTVYRRGHHASEIDSVMKDDDVEVSIDLNDAASEGSGYLERLKRKRLVYEKVDHSQVQYVHFQRDLYREVPELTRMTPSEVVELRRKLDGIRVRGKRCPKPIRSFGQCGLSSAILDVMNRAGYTSPTPIQAQAIPCMMSGRDVIGIAKTGSGKTLAFLLPVLRHVALQDRPVAGEGPIALLIAPTRELAIQIYGEAKKFARVVGLRCVCAYGGSGVKDQIAELKRGADIVICTPGRMIDLLAMNSGRITNLRRVTIVVLDEADRMFDMGFEPQLTRLVENVRPDRQTVMFSATFPVKVENLARRILSDLVEIVVGGRSVAASNIEQHIEVRAEESKYLRLLQLLGVWYEKGSILIFVDRQENADKIYRELSQTGYLCLSLHGGMDQADRDSAIADFKNGDVKVLVATSVAARGLDVRHLSLVVNFDVPNHYEDYVHRVGRTGRAGQRGTAYTFVTPDQGMFAGDLIKALQLSARAATVSEGMSKEEAQKAEDSAANSVVPAELQKLADTFQEAQETKRNAGLVVHGGNSGYGGRGFTFDEKEESARVALRKSQARRFNVEGDDHEGGQDSDVDEDDLDQDDIQVKVVDKSKGGASSAAATSLATAPSSSIILEALSARDGSALGSTGTSTADDGPISPDDVKAMIHAAEEKARSEALNANLSPAELTARIVAAKAEILTLVDNRNRGRRMDVDTAKLHTPEPPAVGKSSAALSAAAAAAAALSAKLGKAKAGSVPSANRGGATGRSGVLDGTLGNHVGVSDVDDGERSFEAEIEINDYPQHARWKVTHANALNDVTENTGCVVTARGNYYPPGRNPPAGERKLHLLIEGDSERAVKSAWRDIKLKLEEAAASRPVEKGLSYSKYSVV